MRYNNVSCSQCGRSFGPGDHGFSHCQDHPGFAQDMVGWQRELTEISNKLAKEASLMDYRYDLPRLIARSLRNYKNELQVIIQEMDPPRKRSNK